MTEAIVQENSGERRTTLRFPLQLSVSYRTFNPASCSGSSAIRTLNISSSGLLFEANETLRPGQHVLVSVEWPVRLDNRVPLNLILEGRILRIESGQAAMQILRHEFKTRGTHCPEDGQRDNPEQPADANEGPEVPGR